MGMVQIRNSNSSTWRLHLIIANLRYNKSKSKSSVVAAIKRQEANTPSSTSRQSSTVLNSPQQSSTDPLSSSAPQRKLRRATQPCSLSCPAPACSPPPSSCSSPSRPPNRAWSTWGSYSPAVGSNSQRTRRRRIHIHHARLTSIPPMTIDKAAPGAMRTNRWWHRWKRGPKARRRAAASSPRPQLRRRRAAVRRRRRRRTPRKSSCRIIDLRSHLLHRLPVCGGSPSRPLVHRLVLSKRI